MNEPKYISVTALNRYIYYKFDTDLNLHDVYLKGEISNYKMSGKHCYFSLKDAASEISAMFFYPDNLNLRFVPKDGMSVQVVGQIQVYQKRGTYAIIVRRMQEEGLGLLYQQYLDLKDKLQAEGLFDESRKLPLPEYPEHVAIITASTGDAIHDIISTFNRRFPLAELKLYPALVQGSEAPRDLIRALKQVYADNNADVLIIGRGGGSFEDLACFNNEELVRTLAASPIPTVSAIGHEADYTICDFVSSYRAPTPTGAAMRLTKELPEVLGRVNQMANSITISVKNTLINAYNGWHKLTSSYVISHFDEVIKVKEVNYQNYVDRLKLLTPLYMAQKLDDNLLNMRNRLMISYNNQVNNQLSAFNQINSHLRDELIIKQLNNWETSVNNLIDKAVILNPLNVMKKGFSIVYQNNQIVKSIHDLNVNANVVVQMIDGTFGAKIISKGENNE